MRSLAHGTSHTDFITTRFSPHITAAVVVNPLIIHTETGHYYARSGVILLLLFVNKLLRPRLVTYGRTHHLLVAISSPNLCEYIINYDTCTYGSIIPVILLLLRRSSRDKRFVPGPIIIVYSRRTFYNF